jgi:hypothetical protein
VHTGGGWHNGNTSQSEELISVGYSERTLASKTVCSVCIHSVVLVAVY